MKIYNQNNSLNFNGFKNIISNRVIEQNGKSGFTYMSMQLNNIGSKDLEIWQNLQKRMFGKISPQDTFTFEIFKNGNNEHFFISNYHLDLSKAKAFPELEVLILRAYSFIASITNRLSTSPAPHSDSNLRQTIIDTENNLKNFLNHDENLAKELILTAFPQKMKHEDLAFIINKSIDRKMQKYFE